MRSTLRCWRVNTRSTVLALSTIAVSSASSCGGATTPTSAPEQTRVGVPTSQTQPTKPGLERQPAPAGLFFVGRVAQPNALVGRLAQWCNLPFDLNDALSLAGDGMEKWVHLEQPVDFALSLAPERDVDEEQDYARDPGWGLDAGVVPVDHPPEVNAIVSIAVSEPEVLLGAFEQAGKSVKAKDNGEFVIEIERDLRCSLGPALGASAQRLTCGVSEYDLDALGAFARTNLATQVMPPKAAYFELRVEPFRTRHGDDVRQMKAMLPEFLREVNIGSERFDRAVGRVARASVDEILAWLDGVDTWNFSVDIARDRDVFVGESTLVFRKDNSYVSNMFRRTAAENTAAPALFWDLPQDVHGASFRAPTSLTEDDRAIASALSELLAGGLEHWGVASGVVDGWLQSLQRLLESRGTVVVANGTMAPPSASKKGQPMGLLGTYYLIGIEGDRGAYVQAWKSSVATFNDKRLRSELAKRLDEDLPQLPLIRYRKVPQTKTTPSVELFELTFKLPKSAASKTFELDKLSMHLAMTVVGERTWIGMGFSEAAALQQVRRVVSAGDYPKLGARRGLDPLHEHRLLHGSFGTIEAYAKLLSGLPLLKNSDSLADDITRAMPHRGTTPAIFEVTTSATGPSMTTRLEVPREVFADGSAFIVALAAASTSALLDVGANDEEGD